MAKITTALFGQLAFIPQVAEVPILEQLSFLTDQIVSWNGTEQNIQLRSKPRQSFNFSIPYNAATGPAMFNTAWGAIRQKWAVPVWTDAQYVGNVTAGAALVMCDTVNYDLRANSLALLYNGCGGYQIVEISSIAADRINVSPVIATTMKGCMLIPVRVGYVSADIGKPTKGHSGKVTINFDVSDTFEYNPTAPDQYLSNDIYYTAGLLDGEMTDQNVTKRNDVIDFDLGVVDRRSPWLISKFGRTFRQVMVTPAERKTYRDFIYRRAGKYRPFWMPTFQHDLRITNTGTIVSTLVTPKDSYLDYATGRTHVAIKAAGVWYPRVISAPTSTGADTMQFTLSSPLNIPASTVQMVSYLGLNRLDTDLIEFNYSSSKAVESAVRILELTP